MDTRFGAAIVIGGGTAGKRIAQVLSRGGLTVDVVAQAGDEYRKPADLVVEAVTEDVAAKRAVLQTVAGSYGPDTVVASTTSAIPLSELASEALRGRLVGLRLAGPPGVPKLVEVTYRADTPAELVADLRDLVRSLGLAPVAVPEGVGTPLTRLLYGLLNDAVRMVERGYATTDTVDAALRLGCGFTAGPMTMLADVGARSARRTLDCLHARTGDPAYRAAPLLGAAQCVGPASAEPRPATARGTAGTARIRRVGVVGSGTMATGIARSLAQHGYEVTVVARSHAAAERVDVQAATVSTSLTDVADSDLVVEAVVEDLAIKRELLARLDGLCRPAAVLATTTSSLSVAACAAQTRRPQRVLGLHFFNPAPSMPLVELVTTDATDEPTAASAVQLCENLGKHVIRCADEPGFVVNRLLFPFLNRAVGLVATGWSPDDIDRSARLGMGLRMGPFRVLDVVGVDVALAVQRNLGESDADLRPHPLLERLAADGYLGDKVGRRVRDHPAMRV